LKTSCHVENHQPVPLRPLDDILGEVPLGAAPIMIYTPELVMDEGSAYDGGKDYEGWYQYDPLAHEFHSVCYPEWWPEPDEVDFHATLARRLQPGERLVVIHEG